jgi:proteasome component ECM29
MRLANPQLTPARDARACVALLLPFLLREGATSAVKDAQRLSLKYLAELARVAGPALRPHVPELALAALQSLSEFEPPGLAYAQQHVSRRANGARAGAGTPSF